MNAVLRLHALSTAFDRQLAELGGSLLSLAIRLYVGWAFFKSGMTKLDDWSTTLFLFQEEYQVPLVSPQIAAYAGTFGELVLPALLFVGLFSRPAALGLFIVNAVALISYPALFEFTCTAAVKDHFYWGALLLVVVAFGPGKLSLDALIGRRAR